MFELKWYQTRGILFDDLILNESPELDMHYGYMHPLPFHLSFSSTRVEIKLLSYLLTCPNVQWWSVLHVVLTLSGNF